MTTIVRKGNIIACDSRYVANRGSVGVTSDSNSPKLYIHETRRAVMALSGFCNNPELFDYIKGITGQIIIDQDTYPRSTVVTAEDIQEYLKKHKLTTYNFTLLVAGPNLTTILSITHETVKIQYYRPHESVTVGTGQLTTLLSSESASAVDIVRRGMLVDDQSGGNIYWVNLDNLEGVK